MKKSKREAFQHFETPLKPTEAPKTEKVEIVEAPKTEEIKAEIIETPAPVEQTPKKKRVYDQVGLLGTNPVITAFKVKCALKNRKISDVVNELLIRYNNED
jgi:hypothetical protein